MTSSKTQDEEIAKTMNESGCKISQDEPSTNQGQNNDENGEDPTTETKEMFYENVSVNQRTFYIFVSHQ